MRSARFFAALRMTGQGFFSSLLRHGAEALEPQTATDSPRPGKGRQGLASGRADFFRGPQDFQKLPHKERQVHPRARSHQVPVDHNLGILELGAGALHVGREGFKGRDRAASDGVHGGQDQRAVTQRGDGLLTLDKVPDDLLKLRVVAKVFRRAAPAQDEAVVSFRLDVREGDVRRNSRRL